MSFGTVDYSIGGRQEQVFPTMPKKDAVADKTKGLWKMINAQKTKPETIDEGRIKEKKTDPTTSKVDDVKQDIFQSTPPKLKDRISKLSTQLLKGASNSGSLKEEAMEVLLPMKDKGKFCKSITPLLEGIKEGKERICVIRALADLDKDARNSVMKNELLAGIDDDHAKANMVQALSKGDDKSKEISSITNPQIKKFILSCNPVERDPLLSLYKQSDTDKTEIFKILSSWDSGKRLEFLNSPLRVQLSSDQILNVIKTLNNPSTLISHLENLFPGHLDKEGFKDKLMSGQILDEITFKFACIDPKKRMEFLALASHLLSNIKQDANRATVILEILKLPNLKIMEIIKLSNGANEQEKMILCSFAARHSNTFVDTNLMQTLASLPVRERVSAATFLGLLWTTPGDEVYMNVLLKEGKLLDRFLQFSPSQQKDINSLLSSTSHPKELFNALEKIPRDQWQDVLKNAKPLLAPNDPHHQIIQALLKIGSDQRPLAAAAVKNHFSGPGKTELKRMSLEAFTKLPSQQWDDFANMANLCFMPRFTAKEMISLFSDFRRIDSRERTEIMELSAPFIRFLDRNAFYEEYTGGHSREESDCQKIISAIRGLSHTQRGKLGEIGASWTPGDVEGLLRRIDEIPDSSTPEIDEEEEEAYYIKIEREKVSKDPRQVLNELSDQFQADNEKTSLHVTFLKEPGTDAGGLGRQFVATLIDALKTKMEFERLDNGLFRPKLAQKMDGSFPPLTDGDKLAYVQLGELMMFCLNAEEDYPIGMVFDHSFFIGLAKLKEEHLSKDFDELGFDDLYPIYKDMHYSEGDLQKIKRFDRWLNPKEDNDYIEAYTTMNYAGEIPELNLKHDDLKKIRENFPKIQEAIKRYIFREEIQPILEPLIEIARGMNEAPFEDTLSWTDLQKMDPSKVSEKLQGTVTKEMIKGKLQFEKVEKEKQGWINEWIDKADEEKIKKFLFTMTGSFALGQKPLQIINKEVDPEQGFGTACFFHTCANTLDIDLKTIDNKDLMFAVIEASLKGGEGFTKG